MGDHDDETVFRHLFQKVHDLHGGLRVEGAGGLVREDDIGVVDKRSRDGDALHLTAGELVRLLVDLIAETDFLERFLRPGFPFGCRHIGNGQSQFHIAEDALVRNEVVVLEHEADRMIAVGVPVLVPVLSRRDAVDDEVAGVIPVEPADDVQKRRLPGPARTQDGYEFIVSQCQRDIVESDLSQFARHIGLADIFDFKQ